MLENVATLSRGLREAEIEGKALADLLRWIPQTALGRVIVRDRMLEHTVNRLNDVNDRQRFPEIEQQSISKPAFAIGLPRTGTTILHDILAQDSPSRAPMTWETPFASPPPETATFLSDPRIALCTATFPDVFDQIQVPSYEDRGDFADVYAFHREQLQHLQSRDRRDRWVFKTGIHLWGLAHLLETNPDGRIVFTHRDPVESMTSYANLTTLVWTMGNDDVDHEGIAGDWTGPCVDASGSGDGRCADRERRPRCRASCRSGCDPE